MIKKSKSKKWLLLGSGIGVLVLTSTLLSVFLSNRNKAFDSSVQLVVSNDETTLTDKSLSQKTYNGIRNFFQQQKKITLPKTTDSNLKEGSGIWKKSGKSLTDHITTYKNIKNDGSDIVVVADSNQKEALQTITSSHLTHTADKKELAKTGFVFVDGSIEKEYRHTTVERERERERERAPQI